MANIVTTSFNYTYDGVLLTQTLFYKPTEQADNIFANYRVFNGVKTKIQLHLPGVLNKLLKEYVTCGFTADGTPTPITNRSLEVTKMKVNVEECADAFFGTVFEDEALKAGVAITDLSGTIVEQVMMTLVLDAVARDMARQMWFNDDIAASADYNAYDGWIEIFKNESANLGQYLDMNTNANIEVAGALVVDGALTLLRSMYENQSKVLRQMPREQKKFFVTATIVDNLMTTYEDTQSSLGLVLLQEGNASVLKFRGIELYEVPGWDTQLADVDNPQAVFVGDNMAVLTIPDNLCVGVDTTSDNLKIRSDDDDDEVLKVIWKIKQGAQIIHPELVSFAY